MARNIVWVLPNGKNWKMTYNKEFKESFSTKEKAIEVGKELAKATPPSQIRIHDEKGVFQTEHTYWDDPYPPRG